MTPIIFGIVILAALLHATWNAIVKGGGDKYLSMTAVVIGQALFGIPPLFFVPAPDPASYPLMAAGICCHIGYQMFLLWAYKIGDFTQVYPLARGSAPMIVAVISIAFLGIAFTPVEIGAVALIGVGIISLALIGKRGGQDQALAVLLALMTSSFIAGYSLLDGLGARAAGTALGYYGWLSIINGVIFTAMMAVIRPGIMRQLTRDGMRVTFIGGGASFIAYALVMWSMTQAPIALVTALRETSIVFAMLIGIFLLGERVTPAKMVSTFIILCGVALLRLAA